MPLMGLLFSAMAIILLEGDRYLKDYSTYMDQTLMYKITYVTASLTRFLAMSPYDFTFFLFAYTISEQTQGIESPMIYIYTIMSALAVVAQILLVTIDGVIYLYNTTEFLVYEIESEDGDWTIENS